MKLVLVEWVDSCADGGGWIYDMDYFTDINPQRCETVGFIVAEDKEKIVLVQGLGFRGDSQHGIINWITIPKCSIKSRRELGQGDIKEG